MKNYSTATHQGEMPVRITITTSGVTKVMAATIAAGVTGPTTPAGDDLFEIPMSGNVASMNNFVVKCLPPRGPFTHNKQLCYWGLNADNEVLELGEPVTFAAVPNPCTMSVLATQL